MCICYICMYTHVHVHVGVFGSHDHCCFCSCTYMYVSCPCVQMYANTQQLLGNETVFHNIMTLIWLCTYHDVGDVPANQDNHGSTRHTTSVTSMNIVTEKSSMYCTCQDCYEIVILCLQGLVKLQKCVCAMTPWCNEIYYTNNHTCSMYIWIYRRQCTHTHCA